MSDRVKPRVVVRIESPNKSSRDGARIDGIVIHSTESHNRPGPSDLEGLGLWFQKRPPEILERQRVSCHVGTDRDGTSGRYVADKDKAWHAGLVNRRTLGIEQIGHAAQSREEWDPEGPRDPQLRETARWVAWWSKEHKLPIRRGKVRADGTFEVRGVVTHAECPGDHWDPGTNYPMDLMLRYARHFRAHLDGRAHKTSPPAYPGTPLRRGSRGTHVVTVQKRLQTVVTRYLVADGVFGAKTEEAVRMFQRRRALDPDGVVGERTWKALWSR